MMEADEVEALARAYDPKAFEDHPIEQRSHVAALQWGARRKLATDAAERAHEAGFRGMTAPVADDRDALGLAVARVLFNVMNYPEAAQARLLGQNMLPLREKVVESVLAEGFHRESVAPEPCCEWCDNTATGTAFWQGSDIRRPSCGEHGFDYLPGPVTPETLNGLTIQDWQKIAAAKDEADAACVAEIDERDEWLDRIAALLPEEYDGDEDQASLIERFIRDSLAAVTPETVTVEDAIRDIEARARDLFNSKQWDQLPERAKANYRLWAASLLADSEEVVSR